MTLELGILTVHTPRMCFEELTPEFQKPLVRSLKKLSAQLEELNPDVILIASCHWMSSFQHYVNATPVHKGALTAFECPELIKDVPYSYPGDFDLASELVEAGVNAGLPVVKVDDPTYIWDYGTLVPLRYLVPKENIPIIDLSLTWAASLEETFQWGRIISKVLSKSKKRAVFISSGALSHNLVRDPARMPTLTEQALNNQFVDYLLKGKYEACWEMLPQYNRVAGVESGARHLAMLLGVLPEKTKAIFHEFGQSSGSGNVIMTFYPPHTNENLNRQNHKAIER
ncbi:extradiol ring-cleavage dioxygenase [Bacillus smithii]|uniref:DODA-type extradiol aromatic ring-opening family dioxygenase n=1 Tax=Bacillus smithii TaxID=1479 RepID=UPI0030C9C493